MLTFGMNEENDFRARNLDLKEYGAEFILETPTGTHVVTSPMLGRFNVFNLLITCHHSCEEKIGSDSIRKVSAFEGVDGRMESVKGAKDYKVVVDYAYARCVEKCIRHVTECTQGKLHVVFGCGGDRDRGKRMEMTRVACAGADLIWATSDNPRTSLSIKYFQI